jgi:very-short-patch-repair endonuclease
MRRIIGHARQLRQDMTDAERAIWFAVRDRRLDGFKFRRQVTVGPFIVDFACVDAMLIVEIDGGQHNETVDAARTAKLLAMGYRVLRFWNNDVLSNQDGVLQTLHAHLLASPSPASGRGPG